MKEKLIEFAIFHPKRILWGTLLLTLGLALMIPRIVIDTDPENMLPANQPDRVIHDQVKKQFNLYDLIVVGVVNRTDPNGVFNPQTIANVKKLSQEIQSINGVISQDLMSLGTVDNISQEGPGTIRFQWMVPNDKPDAADAAAIRQATHRLPMFVNTLVSGDEKAAAIYVPIKDKNESHRIASAIRQLTVQLPGNDHYYITGLPVAEDTFGVEMFVQMAISAPLAALAIFLLMWFFFRSFALITAPMLMAMATVIMTMGALIGLGYTVHIMSSMIPIFLMPIAVVDSVHILSEFAELHKPGDDIRATVRRVMNTLFQPMFYTSVTSVAGFASLAFTPIPPVQVFGMFVAIGIALAFVLTILFIPAYIVNLSPERIQSLATKHHGRESKAMAGTLGMFRGLSVGASKLVILVAVVLAGISYYGIQQIRINDNPVRWFKAGHEIRVADQVLNSHFAGTYDAYLVLRYDTKPTEEKFASELGSLAQQYPVIAQLRSNIKDSGNFPQYLNRLLDATDQMSFDASGTDVEALDALTRLVEKSQTALKKFQDPAILHYIADLQAHLQSSGLIGKSNALPDMVKTVYRELRGGNTNQFRIPDTQSQVAQTLLSYQSSHRPNDLWHFVTPNYDSAVIWLQMKSGDNKDMTKVVENVNQYFAKHPLPQYITHEWAGLTYINVIWQDSMVKGMLKSLLGAFAMVFVMMVFLFRSVIFGILAMVPLSLTISMIYGLIGIVGKDYDMPVAVLSSLTLGLSVDFAIHFLERCRSLFQETGSWAATIQELFKEPAVAISRNAIVIAIGFLPLLAAPLVPYNTVGIFLAAIMATSCIITLALLPALLNAFNKWLFKAPVQGA